MDTLTLLMGLQDCILIVGINPIFKCLLSVHLGLGHLALCVNRLAAEERQMLCPVKGQII